MNTTTSTNGHKNGHTNGHATYAKPDTTGLQEMRLRLVKTADFRKSEETLLEECKQEAEVMSLGARDVVLLVSGTGKMIKFVFGFLEHEMINAGGREVSGRKTKVLPSRTYRITDGGTWNPYMIRNYAEELGLSLPQLKKFESHLRAELSAS